MVFLVDKEELRADRAVKVSRKELNELISELFEYTDIYDTNLIQNTSTLEDEPEMTVLPTSDETPATSDVITYIYRRKLNKNVEI